MKRLIIALLMLYGLAGCAVGDYQAGLEAAGRGD
jgi:hypothetical protein